MFDLERLISADTRRSEHDLNERLIKHCEQGHVNLELRFLRQKRCCCSLNPVKQYGLELFFIFISRHKFLVFLFLDKIFFCIFNCYTHDPNKGMYVYLKSVFNTKLCQVQSFFLCTKGLLHFIYLSLQKMLPYVKVINWITVIDMWPLGCLTCPLENM